MAPRFVTCVQPTYSFSSLSHTHTYTLTDTHRPSPNNKSNLWHLGFGSSVSSGAARWREEAATSECDITSHVSGVNGSGGAKNKGPRREHVCYWRLNEWMHEGLAMNGHTMSWLVWPPKRFVNICTLCVTTRETWSAGDNEGNLD